MNLISNTESYPHASGQVSKQIMEQLFGNSSLNFDLNKGTVLNITDVRIIYLSADIIRSIYDVLKYEAGDAWSLILKNCGVIWGERISASLDKEVYSVINQKMGQLNVDDFIELLESYFASHGWGKMQFSLDDAETNGIVRATLKNSLFAETLKHLNTPVEFMIAGMLQGIFSTISGHELSCIQVSYDSTGTESSEFLISAKARIDSLEHSGFAHELNPNEALARLRFT
jgi:predicted hydrocarbon binding protein